METEKMLNFQGNDSDTGAGHRYSVPFKIWVGMAQYQIVSKLPHSNNNFIQSIWYAHLDGYGSIINYLVYVVKNFRRMNVVKLPLNYCKL